MKTLQDVLAFARSSALSATDGSDLQDPVASYRENIRDTLVEYNLTHFEFQAFAEYDALVADRAPAMARAFDHYQAIEAAQAAVDAAQAALKEAEEAAMADLNLRVGDDATDSQGQAFRVEDVTINLRGDGKFSVAFVGTKLTKTGALHAGRARCYKFVTLDVPSYKSVGSEIGGLKAEYENGCDEAIANLVRDAMHAINQRDLINDMARLDEIRTQIDLYLGFSGRAPSDVVTYRGGNHVAVIRRPANGPTYRVVLITSRF